MWKYSKSFEQSLLFKSDDDQDSDDENWIRILSVILNIDCEEVDTVQMSTVFNELLAMIIWEMIFTALNWVWLDVFLLWNLVHIIIWLIRENFLKEK